MKKILTLFLFTALFLTGCSDISSGQQDVGQNSTSANEQTSNYDPFAKPDISTTTVGSFGFGVEWEDEKEFVLDYTSTVSFRYYVDNSGETTDFGLLLFVNGVRQPYHTEDNSENKVMHIFDANQNERKVLTIEFEPVIGEMGDEVLVEIISMFQPSFIQTENSNYGFNHRISSLYPSKMSVTQETGLSKPEVCSDYIDTPITDEMRQEFNEVGTAGGISGENALDNSVFIEALKNDVFYTPADLLETESDNSPFTMNDSVTLCMYGGGKPCKYRVSMYINHELVKGAFDGSDYIDMIPSSSSICKKTIDMEKLNLTLEDYNHLYFIAVPFYTNDNYEERMVLKSASVTLDSTK